MDEDSDAQRGLVTCPDGAWPGIQGLCGQQQGADGTVPRGCPAMSVGMGREGETI